MEQLKKLEAPPSHFDVLDELSTEEITEAHEKADKKFEDENDHELNLIKSPMVVPGQDWTLISFVGEECSQKTKEFGIKIWGTFPDIETSKQYLKEIGSREENKYFDIYIIESRAWVKIPPEQKCIEDEVYHDERLNTLIDTHKKEQYRSQEVFDTRKEKLKNNPDVNQHYKNKEVLKELKQSLDIEVLEDNVQEKGIQNEEAMKKIFGEPKKLPTFTIEEQKPEGTEIQGTDLPISSNEESTPSEILDSLS